MKDAKKDARRRRVFHVSLDDETAAELDSLSEQSGLRRSTLARLAIKEWLRHPVLPMSGTPQIRPRSDDQDVEGGKVPAGG